MRRTGTGRKGFTLVELLVIVAIIAVLAAIAVPGVLALSRGIALTALDDSAHTVFLAAQNNLTAMKNAGEDLSALGSAKVALPADGTAVTGEYHAVTDPEQLARLVPAGSVDGELYRANYVVEIDRRTGAVYAVWFWEDAGAFSYAEEAYRVVSSKRSERLGKNRKVGYYGGTAVDRPSVKQTPLPTVLLENAEELRLTVTMPAEALLSVSVTGEGESGRKTVPIVTEMRLVPSSGGNYVAEIALDSLAETEDRDGSDGRLARRFKDWVCRDDLPDAEDDLKYLIYPGTDFDLEVKVCLAGEEYLPQYSYKNGVNSLFASVERAAGDPTYTAKIAYGRHLQNLDVATSVWDSRLLGPTAVLPDGLPLPIFAKQTKDIDFSDSGNGVFSWQDTYKDRAFRPIETKLDTGSDYVYDGQGHELRGITLKADGNYAGLFADMTHEGVVFKNMRLIDLTSESAAVTAAGALAGAVNAATVENCRVYLENKDASGFLAPDPRLRGTNVGGFFGISNKNLTVKNSFAATVLEGDTVVGGLVGVCGDTVAIENSYAAGHLSGKTVGGLIGKIDAGNVDIKMTNCYAAGAIASAESAGGLIAEKTAAVSPVADRCYAAVRYGSGIPTVYGTFSGDAVAPTPYVAQTGMTYEASCGTPLNAFALSLERGTGVVQGNPYRLLSATQKECSLSKDYPYRAVGTGAELLPHYGDWLEEVEVYPVYYEKYADGVGVYANNDRFKVNTLKTANSDDDLDKRVYALDDGYAFLILAVSEETRKQLPRAAKIGGEDVTPTTLTEQSFSLLYEGKTIACTAFVLGEAISIPADGSATGAKAPLDPFYTTLAYPVSDADKNYGYAMPFAERTYFFNPHFACELYDSRPTTSYGAKPGAAGLGKEENYENTVVIRTARQFSNLHAYTNTGAGVSGVKSATIHQLLDIDFEMYEAKSKLSGGSGREDRLTPALLWRATYDGNSHLIRNAYLNRDVAGEEGTPKGMGLFGKAVESDLRNIFLVNATGYVDKKNVKYSMGGLVGYIDRGTVENCGIYVENKDDPNYSAAVDTDRPDTDRPYYRHRAVNSNDENIVVGGLIGKAEGACTISKSFAAVKVYGATAGGFIGEMGSGVTVSDCYSGGYTKYADRCEIGGTVYGNVGGYPAYSDAPGSNTVNVDGRSTSGGFVGSVDVGAVFQGICYSTCSVFAPMGLFAGDSPEGYKTEATLYATGVAISKTGSSQTFQGTNYTFYTQGTPRVENYLVEVEKVIASEPKCVAHPYNSQTLAGQAFPYQTNLSTHYGDWV